MKTREFEKGNLFGGCTTGGRGKISWENQRKVCHPKSRGGLGVKDVRLVNVSLEREKNIRRGLNCVDFSKKNNLSVYASVKVYRLRVSLRV